MNTEIINQKLVDDGRDLRYIEGFWAGYRLACMTLKQQLTIKLNSPQLNRAESEAEFLLSEKERDDR